MTRAELGSFLCGKKFRNLPPKNIYTMDAFYDYVARNPAAATAAAALSILAIVGSTGKWNLSNYDNQA